MRAGAVALLAALAAASAALVSAQSQSAASGEASRGYDVASVKPDSENRSCLFDPGSPRGEAIIRGCPVGRLIQYSYELTPNQLIGVPAWDRTVFFTINARYEPASAPTRHDQLLLVRKLLADRFGLAVHREQRQIPVYALTVARGDGRLGKDLKRSDIDCAAWIADGRWPYDEGVPSPYTPFHERPACSVRPGADFIVGGTQTMAELAAWLLNRRVGDGRPIVDKTGLAGGFDYDLRWSQRPLGATPDATVPDDAPPDIFTAMQEQLGLKLESTTMAQEVVVVDHVSQPTPD